jgi:uncharacterized membrane protein YhaH (DUF805 family)
VTDGAAGRYVEPPWRALDVARAAMAFGALVVVAAGLLSLLHTFRLLDGAPYGLIVTRVLLRGEATHLLWAAGAPLLTATASRRFPPSRGHWAGRVWVVAAWVWAVGAAVEWSSGLVHGRGGWFNYAPNSGVVFSPGGALAIAWIGELLAAIGLVAAAAATLTTSRRTHSRRSPGVAALLIGQLVVVIVGTWIAVRVGVCMVTTPGAWGLA